MYNKNINDLHTEKYSSKEAPKNIRKIKHKKEYRACLSRQFQISHPKAKDIQFVLFCFSNNTAFPGCPKLCMVVL